METPHEKKLHTLLVHLPVSEESNDSVHQPYGLAVLSAFLKKNGCRVTLYDANAHRHSVRHTLQHVVHLCPDILGLTVYSNQLFASLAFLREIKKRLPSIVTVTGGPHPSSPEHRSLLANHPEVDFAVIGEGEETMLELIERLQSGEDSFDDIRGIAFRSPIGTVSVTPPRPYIENLDALPFADWDSLPMDQYWAVSAEKKNFANVLFSRGCPYSCSFCASKVALGQRVRRRSPDNIIEEIQLLYHHHDVREICFNDATMNVDNQWVREISQGLMELNLPDFVWGCNLRANNVDPKTLQMMKQSGCTNVFMGIESGDDRMLAAMGKGTNVAMIRQSLRMCDEAGIKVYCGFIFGMPGETEDSLKRTLAFAKELRRYSVAFSLATPFPGTEFYRTAQQEGFHIQDWTSFDYHGVTYVPAGLTKDTLLAYYNSTLLTYYTSIPFLFNQLRQIRSWHQLFKSVRLGYRILFARRRRLRATTTNDKATC